MRAMVLESVGSPLQLKDVPVPMLEKGQILLRVQACAVCRTDLHLVEGDLEKPHLPIIPGHQVVGIVEKIGEGVANIQEGELRGIPWLWKSCGECRFCVNGKENLCDKADFTGYTKNGGFAEYCVGDANFSLSLPGNYSYTHAAPLLCGGLIGYRAYRMTNDANRIGFYGFGASAHILIQLANHQKKEIYVFTRPGDTKAQQFAKTLGAAWVGDSTQAPPKLLDAAIIFAPVGALIPTALKAVDKGGIVICAGIHMTDIPSFPYQDLWEERTIRSVANLTRQDGLDFLSIASELSIKTEVKLYSLTEANQALDDLKHGRFSGTAVLIPK